MLKQYLQERTLSLVILGNFNPGIVQPFWLSSKGLIKEVEARDASLKVIHPQLSQFDLDWVFIELSGDRATFISKKAAFFNPILDLIDGIFSYLPETPITALGINHIYHYQIPTVEQYDQCANAFVPLRNWSEVMEEPKLLELTILEQKRRDKTPGSYSIKLQPSEVIKHLGLQLSVNDHFSLDGLTESGRDGEVLSRVKEGWRESFSRADSVGEILWTKLKS